MSNFKALSYYLNHVNNKPFLLVQLALFKLIGFVFSTNYHRFKFILPIKLKSGKKLLYMYELFIQRNPESKKFYDTLANPKYGTLLDLGANIGTISQYFLSQNQSRQAFLIEPQKRCCEYLKKTIDPYKAQIYCFAAGSVTSKSKLYKKNELDVNASIFIIPKKHYGRFSDRPKKNESINMQPIDNLNINAKIDLVKINIEGGEPEAIKGMLDLIVKNKPDILFDPHNEWNLKEIKRLLSASYKVTKIDNINYLAVYNAL